MKLLICTQVVDQNDPALGFFVEWLREFANQCEQITVVCLREGQHDLPAHVSVVQLGGATRIGKALRLMRIALSRRNDYTHIFVHMNPEYIVAMGALWRMMGKKIGLWYMHKSVTLSLRIAALLAHHIFTGSKESFRLATPKLHVMGHGINTAQFFVTRVPRTTELRIITVGRLSESKGVLDMLGALDILHVRGIAFTFTIVGAPATEEDKHYAVKVEDEVARRAYKNNVRLVGGIAHAELPHYLAQSDVFLNLSSTGSLDKAVLEAIMAGVAPVTSNEAFKPLLQGQGLWVGTTDPQKVAEAILLASESDTAVLQTEVRAQHSLNNLIPAILKILA